MPLSLGQSFPNFCMDSTEGLISFYRWLGDESWCIVFSYTADFHPICVSELGVVAKMIPEFTKRNTKVVAFSCDSVKTHKAWIDDVTAYHKMCPVSLFPFSIIADPKKDLTIPLGVVDPIEEETLARPLPCRAVFIISPDKKLKLQFFYPSTVGRDFDEVLRALDSLQLTEEKQVATPANWQPGGDCMINKDVSEEDAAKLFPKGYKIADVPSYKTYLRTTPQP